MFYFFRRLKHLKKGNNLYNLNNFFMKFQWIKLLTDSPDLCDKLLDEAFNNIPISTRKRKLFDNKPPLSDSSNMYSVSINTL